MIETTEKIYMKKLLMINNSLSGGGSERVMVMLTNEFVKRGYDVDMILCATLSNETYVIDPKVKLLRFDSRKLKGPLFVWAWYRFIRKVLRKEKYVKVISFLRNHNVVTLLAAKGTRNKVIVSERNNPFANKRKVDLFHIGEQLLYPTADAVVFQTKDIQKRYKYSIRKKSCVIPNPVNPDIISINRCHDNPDKIIIAAGRLHKQKNYPLLLKSFRIFSDLYPEYRLCIYGKGELEHELKELVKLLKIEDKVEFKGYVNDINEMMRTASMFVISSDYEGISNSMVEALAIGLPTIATDCPVGGARMLIESGVNGILVPVGDERALADAMIRIARDSVFAEHLGQEAVKVKENYSIKKITDMWEDIILT